MWKPRQLLARELHRRGIYRLGRAPFGLIDKSLHFRRLGIDLVIDAGANVGAYSAHLRQFGYDGRIISLEPAPAAFAELSRRAQSDPLWDIHQMAVGSVDGEAPLNVASNSGSSSLLATTSRFGSELPDVAVVASQAVPVRRLDTFVPEVQSGAHVWVKLDVEGSELPAIQGAGELLARADALEIELATERLYENEPLFFEVAAAVYEFGLRLTAVAHAFTGPSGRLLRFDGLFVR